ncbi:MAG: type II toxin-antitoxin system HicB family antitoxin [Clostridiales bacterium]|nr:type II toxin-antitoxin system HicB family antitoxin [Clostridiales bacterium]
MKLTYPAIFEPLGDRPGYVVAVPDLPGCVTEGDSLADAILMAQDAASGWVLDELEDGNPAPRASDLSALHTEGDRFISLLVLDMDAYAEKYGAKAVRKNLTIPAWLNTFAEKQRVNFSQLLTETLTSLYQQQYQ